MSPMSITVIKKHKFDETGIEETILTDTNLPSKSVIFDRVILRIDNSSHELFKLEKSTIF